MRIPWADGETTSPLVISGGTLVDGTGRAPLSDSVIVIQGGQIVTVATVAAGSIPVDGRRLETHGKWIIPGLIDMHVHYYDFSQRSRQRCFEELLSCMFQSRRAFRVLLVRNYGKRVGENVS